jgi:hypothetical protein
VQMVITDRCSSGAALPSNDGREEHVALLLLTGNATNMSVSNGTSCKLLALLI